MSTSGTAGPITFNCQPFNQSQVDQDARTSLCSLELEVNLGLRCVGYDPGGRCLLSAGAFIRTREIETSLAPWRHVEIDTTRKTDHVELSKFEVRSSGPAQSVRVGVRLRRTSHPALRVPCAEGALRSVTHENSGRPRRERLCPGEQLTRPVWSSSLKCHKPAWVYSCLQKAETCSAATH